MEHKEKELVEVVKQLKLLENKKKDLVADLTSLDPEASYVGSVVSLVYIEPTKHCSYDTGKLEMMFSDQPEKLSQCTKIVNRKGYHRVKMVT